MAEGKHRRRWMWQTLLGLVALPVSLVPFWLYGTKTDAGSLMYLRARYQVLPPKTPALRPEAALAAIADRQVHFRGVPVLVYHGIGRTPADTHERRYVVSRGNFAEQMRSLRRARYSPITTRALARYLEGGRRSALPKRPILITFDDGRVDAMLQGDRILRDTGMKATMFVIGHAAEGESPYYERWNRLSKLAGSGRWELAHHTYDLHHTERSPGGRQVAALVSLQKGETIAEYRERLGEDLGKEARLVHEHGGRAPVAFAYPFGDWGERAGAATIRALRGELRERFAVAFDQDYQDGWRPAEPGGEPLRTHRLSVGNWSGPRFLRRLERGYRLQQRG